MLRYRSMAAISCSKMLQYLPPSRLKQDARRASSILLLLPFHYVDAFIFSPHLYANELRPLLIYRLMPLPDEAASRARLQFVSPGSPPARPTNGFPAISPVIGFRDFPVALPR